MPKKLKGMYRCQFCEKESPAKNWKDDKCPKCNKEYDVLVAQDSEE
jgi:Zn finger protein HypA/HybF involved in hydrogenase expression